ncbi:MAG: signal protein [Myxococcaceae bacterium]|nr:signal protein [Myxococcaceae bacterium]
MDATPESPRRPGRRTFVVDRRFQYKYTLMLGVLGAAISLVFGTLMYLAHRDALTAALRTAELPESIRAQNATLLWLIGGITVLMGAALALFGLLVTHRVAGPVHVMSHYLGVLARGRYPMMRPLRRSDELRGFFERFQEAIEGMRTKDAEEADTLEEALRVLGPLATSDEAHKALEALRAMQERKRDATDRVDIGPQSQKTAA